MPIGVITFNFDPLLYIGDTTQVRIQTVVLGLIFAASLLLAILIARVISGRLLRTEGPGIALLRIDDFGFIAVGVVPGAVVGGRLGYVLLHLDFYAKHVGAIVDPSQGNLELGLAVAGGALSGAYVARLLEAPVGRWADALIVPVLFALGAGKLALILGGEGQGLPSSVSWATAYGGDGPWGSLAPTIPSHPSQAYEGVVTLVLLVIVGALQLAGLFRRRTGSAFLVGIALWAIGRAVVAATWRDAAILGPLRVDQLMSFLIVAACLVLLTLDIQPAAEEEEEGPAPEPWEAWDLDVERRLLGGRQALQLPAGVSAEASAAADQAQEAGVASALVSVADEERADEETATESAPDAEPAPAAESVGESAGELAQESAPEGESVTAPEGEPAPEAEPVARPEDEPEPEPVAEAEPVAEPEEEREPEPTAEVVPVAEAEPVAELEPTPEQPTDERLPAPRPDGASEQTQAPTTRPTPEPAPTFWLASEEDAGSGSNASRDGPIAAPSVGNNEPGEDVSDVNADPMTGPADRGDELWRQSPDDTARDR